MGKYATYRKRGRHTPTPSGLPVPQTPLLYVDQNHLYSDAVSLPDTAGTMRLWFSATEAGEYDHIATTAPALAFEWANIVQLESGWFKVNQTGGGVQFAGTSPLSAAFEYEVA